MLDTKVFGTKCCRLGPSFIELHRVNLTIQISLYVLETIQGYVSLLSPVKQFKGSKWSLTQFFVMDILIDSETLRGVFFKGPLPSFQGIK